MRNLIGYATNIFRVAVRLFGNIPGVERIRSEKLRPVVNTKDHSSFE